MKVQFDHAAIATDNPTKLKKIFTLLGLLENGEEEVASQGVKTHFLKPTEKAAAQIEILEILDPKGVVAKFLEKKGPGIHHLSFKVDNIQYLMEVLKSNNIRLTYPEAPRPGAHHTLVNFIHPESTGGILIEISQNALK